ncbi:dnaJ homolog subfamily C member 1-like [Biomphalaria glabrata]|uniref:DnaJ homolog subfamily C member 2 n=1 Tax=Biomphalaria glabrata TaxID=6526 RepID=A0A9U8EJK0_BIOGL|nr:dnaJ homolog subfamily C member 1-like [Biomphalaria glabrata]
MAAKYCGELLLTLLVLFVNPVHGWDSDDLEIFDLVEEINVNFYQYFGIEQSASTSEIKKAYRKLTLQYHPDKNSAEDAEEKFRQIVAIYEVLKDDNKRAKYNQVLVEGLPDWRQPVYYYRRARKMGIYELAILMFIIFTLGQYFVAWAIYIEKRLVLDEVLSSKKKKEKKKKKQAAVDDCVSEEESIPTPRVLDLWPFRLSVYIFFTIYNLPATIHLWLEERKKRQEREEEARAAALEESKEEFIRKPKKRAQMELPEYSSEMLAKYSEPLSNKKETQTLEKDITDMSSVKKGDWTSEELVLLSKAVNKFPGGTHDRWEKIAEMVGRTVADVTAKAKETKGNYSMNLSDSVQSSFSKSLGNFSISDYIITQNEDGDDILVPCDENGEPTVRKRHKPTKIEKTAERTLLITQSKEENPSVQANVSSSLAKGPVKNVLTINSDVIKSKEPWTQNQQTIFEWALKQYPKGTEARWDKVAQHIPGKTKEDCILRFKELAELVSKRKKEQVNVSK